MDANLAALLVSGAAALVFFITEWLWPNEPHAPFADLGLNTLAALIMLGLGAAATAGTALLLAGAFGRVALFDSWPMLLRGLVFIVLTDAARYAAHRLLHRPGWWRAHRFHHSIEHVNWFSGMRAAPLHVLLFVLPGALLAWALDLDLLTQAINFTLMSLSNHLMHTNTRIPHRLQKALEWLIVTPRYHRVHHHLDPQWRDTNFGAMFSFWDALFGTRVDPERLRGQPARYGLAEDDRPGCARIVLGL